MTERLDGWQVATRAVSVVLIASIAALGATGVPLIWRYTPLPSGLRAAHVATAVLFTCSAVALLCVLLVRRLAARRRKSSGWVAGVAGVAGGVVGMLTGRMIAWDWIGLWAVSLGDWSGVLRASFSDNVRFVHVDGTDVAQTTYRFWAIVHLILLPALCVSGAIPAAMRMRSRVSLRRELALGERGREASVADSRVVRRVISVPDHAETGDRQRS